MASSALERLRNIENLREVWKGYWASARRKLTAGVDGVTPQAFHGDLERQLRLLRDELREGYSFSSLRGVAVPKKDRSTLRLICVPTVRDRLVQRAVLRVIEADAQRLGILNDVSFGFVKASTASKRGAHAARQAAVELRKDYPWVLKADISSFFDSIQRERLTTQFGQAFRKKAALPLVRGAVSCEVLSDEPRVRRALAENNIRPGRGLRQGMPLSPILSNVVLRDFDRVVGRSNAMVRYADDFIIFAKTRGECEDARGLVTGELEKLGLRLSTAKTFISAPEEATEFLGLELRLQQITGQYGLVISQGQLDEIRAVFSALCDWTVAEKECSTVGQLFRRLEQMKIGYRSAYGVADNFDTLDRCLDAWVRKCSTSIYNGIFTKASVDRLTERQRKFLSMP